MALSLISVASILCMVSVLANATPSEFASNVCEKEVPIESYKRVEVPVTKKIRNSVSLQCRLFNNDCDQFETTIDVRLQKTVIYRKERACCPGYAESPDRQCLPVCLRLCRNGKCTSPGVCECVPSPTDNKPGYSGATCSRFVCLALDKWGPNCDRQCDCAENEYCNAQNGLCSCREGWTGPNCTIACTRSMACEDEYLPAVFEPESNAISLAQTSEYRERSSDTMEPLLSATSIYLINFTLVLALCVVVLALIYYRNNFNQMKSTLYNAAYSSIYSDRGSSSSTYSDPNSSIFSVASSGISSAKIKNRPLVPTPDDIARMQEREQLSKNLDFNTTTRNILLDGQKSPRRGLNHKFVADPLTEIHLITSQKGSEQNAYSVICSLDGDRSKSALLDDRNSSMNTDDLRNSSAVSFISDDDHGYQVPRLAALRQVDLDTLTESQMRTSQDEVIYDTPKHSRLIIEDSIYEEIKPKQSDDRNNTKTNSTTNTEL